MIRCPRCDFSEKMRILLSTYSLVEDDGRTDTSNLKIEEIYCPNCWLPLLSKVYGWASEIYTKIEELKKSAEEKGLTVNENLWRTLEVPLCYIEGGVYSKVYKEEPLRVKVYRYEESKDEETNTIGGSEIPSS